MSAEDIKKEFCLHEEVLKLATLSLLEYEKTREKKAEQLGVRLRILDKAVNEARKGDGSEDSGKKSIVSEVEPWEDEVVGAWLLNKLQVIYEQHIKLPYGASIILALWTLFTYCHNLFRVSPYLGIVSPEKRCGKSTAMSLLKFLTNKPILASNITPAAVFRTIEICGPTLLIDEADTFLKNNDELRGIINSGHTKDTAFVIRTVGENYEPERFATWCPKAIAMIGNLPETLADRSIIVHMRRKLSSEKVERLTSYAEEEFFPIRRQCMRWAKDNATGLLLNKAPEIPDIGNDRAMDNWMPLLTIAGVVGEDWPEKTLNIMRNAAGRQGEEGSLGPMLLYDINKIFTGSSIDRISSANLTVALNDIEDRPWAELNRGKPLTVQRMASILRGFEIRPKKMRLHDGEHSRPVNGYERKLFDDAFNRYLPPVQSRTTEQPKDNSWIGEVKVGTMNDDVSTCPTANILESGDCSIVPTPTGVMDAGNTYPDNDELERLVI